MKKIKQMFPIVNGLFYHLDYDFPEDVPKSQLDLYFVMHCGDRLVAPIVSYLADGQSTPLTSEQLRVLAGYIKITYSNKWDRLKALYELEYDPIHNFSDITTEKISDSIDEESENKTTKTETLSHSEVLEKDSTTSVEDDLSEEVTTSDSGNSTRTDNLRQVKSDAKDIDETRTDDLAGSKTLTHTSEVTLTNNLSTETTHSETDSETKEGQNNVFGFNSSNAVGDRTDASESSATNEFTDSVADSGTQVTETQDSDSEHTTNVGTVKTATGVTESEETSNTGTVANVTTSSGSSTKENTGTRTTTEDVDSTNTISGNSTKTGTDTAEKHNTYARNRTLSRNGNIGNLTTQQMIAEEIEVWRWNFVNQILDDVKDLLTVPVYD